VTSAATAGGFPRDGADEIALVGRSNVGKSSLINALVRRRVARTSGAPGKTRLANLYRVARRGAPFYFVDLPGYGYTRGDGSGFDEIAALAFARQPAGLLIVDARHPGLASDLQAWTWMMEAVAARAIVVNKIDKLSRAQRRRAIRENEAVFEHPVLPVSADTGEGMDELWKLIDRLRPSSSNPARRVPSGAPPPPEAPPPPAPALPRAPALRAVPATHQRQRPRRRS
jgi:GTP-binding protein